MSEGIAGFTSRQKAKPAATAVDSIAKSAAARVAAMYAGEWADLETAGASTSVRASGDGVGLVRVDITNSDTDKRSG